MFQRKIAIAWIVILVAVPVILLILPANYFDFGETWCPSKRFLDIECIGCGLTRGVQHSIHLDFETGWHFNKLSPFILLALIYLWVKLLIKNINIIKKDSIN